MKKYIAASAALCLALLPSCSFDEADPVSLEELGVPTQSYTVPATAGDLSVPFLANQAGSVTLLDEAAWLQPERDRFDQDGDLVFHYAANGGFRRMSRVLFALDANPRYACDTVVIRQEGVEPYLTFTKSSAVVFNGQDRVTLPLETNLDASRVEWFTRILDGSENWIRGLSFSPSGVTLELSDNHTGANRQAAVDFRFDDGWGTMQTVQLRLTQIPREGGYGTEWTFRQLRDFASSLPSSPGGDAYIKGYVVSDRDSRNVAENPMVTTSSIDYSMTDRSVILENEEGLGFLVVTETVGDNLFEKDRRVLLSLEKATVRKLSSPERYVIEGVTSFDLMESEAVVSVPVPVKEKHIGDLTDEDVYTLVTLTDVEWPVRKGSLSPCYEPSTNSWNNDYATKFPTLLRCKDGNSLYLLTNSTCPYRRDGTRMGYGGGSVRGILVHELHPSFVDEDNADPDLCGNIGRYQLRHQSRGDFMLPDDFHDGFSEMICEFRWVDPAGDGSIRATYGAGSMIHQGPDHAEYQNYPFKGMYYYDFSYLGPIGSNDAYIFGKNTGNKNGLGIIREDGTDYGKGMSGINSNGNGRTDRLNPGLFSWGALYWWDFTNKKPYYWDLTFSTNGISTDVLSLQLSMLNQCQTGGTPRDWKIEWSTSGDYDRDEDWSPVATFELPDITPSDLVPQRWMSPMFKPMDFPLPQAMLGKETVHIRIGPRTDRASDMTAYRNRSIVNTRWIGGTIDYLAIRYNK